MNCQEARSLVEDVLDRRLSGSAKRRFDLHLSRCRDCRDFFAAETAEHTRWFRALNASDGSEASLPSDFTDRLVAAVMTASTRSRSFWKRLRLPRWVGMAACLAVALVSAAAIVTTAVVLNDSDSVAESSSANSPASQSTYSSESEQVAKSSAALESNADLESIAVLEFSSALESSDTTKQTEAVVSAEIAPQGATSEIAFQETEKGERSMNSIARVITAGFALSVATGASATDYTWSGGGSTAAITDAGNWGGTAGQTLSFRSGDTLRIATESAAPIVDANVKVKSVTISADGVSFANPDAATTNTLFVTKISNTSSTVPVFNCRVEFEDEWTASVPICVSGSSQTVDFEGGVIGKYPDPQTEAARTFKGHYVLNGKWTMPNATYTYTVPSGSTLKGRTLTGEGSFGSCCTLAINEGGEAYFDYINQGVATMAVSVNGKLKVDHYDLTRGHVGVAGNTGTLIVNRLDVTSTDYNIYVNVPNIVFGGFFAWNQTQRLALCAAEEVNFQFTDNTKWTQTSGANNQRTGGDVVFNTQDPDTGVGHVVQIDRGLQDNDNSEYGVVGEGHIIKDGMGAMIFGGAIPVAYNAYTGGTTINQGMVASINAGQNIGTGTVTVNSGAVLNPSGGGSLGYPIVVNEGGTAIFPATTTASSLTLNSGSTLQVSAAYTLTATALTLPESGTVNLLVTGGSTTEGPITLISFPSGTTSTEDDSVNEALLAKFSLVRNNGTLAIDAENNALVMTDYTAPTFEWVGGTDDKFSTGANWSSGYAPAPGDDLVFSAAAGGTLTNDIVGLGFASLSFTSGAGSYTINGEPMAGVTVITNTSSVVQYLNNSIHCADAINYYCTSDVGTYFNGGVMGTTPNLINQSGSGGARRKMFGKWKITNSGWIPTKSWSYFVGDGAEFIGVSMSPNTSATSGGSNRPKFGVEDGGYAHFYESVDIGNSRNFVYANGNGIIKSRIFQGSGTATFGTYTEQGQFYALDKFHVDTARDSNVYLSKMYLGGELIFGVGSYKACFGCNQNTYIGLIDDAKISHNQGVSSGYRLSKSLTIDTEDEETGAGHILHNNVSPRNNGTSAWGSIVKTGKGVVEWNGTRSDANAQYRGLIVSNGTFFANTTHACGNTTAVVENGGILAVTNGATQVTSITTATINEGGTFAVGVTGRSAAAITGTLTVSGAATVKVVGDVSSLTESTNIPLAATCSDASFANLSLDSSGLTLPNENWQTQKMLSDGSLMLRVIKSGFYFLVR